MNLARLALGAKGPLIDISLARDLVTMGSRCGNNDPEKLGDERDKVHLTKWKHNTKIELVYTLAF